MTRSSEPDNVIALSRYRAQLGRGRRLRRADALLSGPEPERAIRALPGDELYYVIHEIGLRDAGDILAHARADQVQAALDFAIWERDQIVPERLGEWLELIAEVPYERISEWAAGLDVELLALILRKTSRVYDLTEEELPDEPEGTLYPTPDTFFALDVRGTGESGDGDGEASSSARAVIRLVDSIYRVDKDFARRILVGARSELDSELEEQAYHWRQGRMEDLGFADYYQALEVYRELDPASVRVGEVDPGKVRVRPLDAGDDAGSAARAPTALVERLSAGTSPFARAVQGLTSAEEVAELHFALVALTNRVLAADRVTPGDDPAIAAALDRMAATLDIAVEFLGRGDEGRAREAVRTVPLVRLFRLGVSLVGKVRRLALTLRRKGPFAALRPGPDLAEPEDAVVLDAVTRARPLFPGQLDDPATARERPFRSLADVARATVAIQRAAAAQAMLLGLGVTPAAIAPGSPALEEAGLGEDRASLDTGLLARTALVRRLLGKPATPFEPLDAREVREYQAQLEATPEGATRLPAILKKKVKAVLDAVSPADLGAASAGVAERWTAGLAPLEPVLVRKPRPRKK
jgi:hypothetical protein